MAENRLRAVKAYYDSSRGGFVTLEDDVLSIVRQVRDLYGDSITIELDPTTSWFHFVGHENGTDYLIFSTDCLDARALDRLLGSDSQRRYHQDPYDAAEREQDELNDAKDEISRGKIVEAGEMLAYYMKKEGRAPLLPATVAIPRSLNADR
jgi:hypothetical protein